MHKAPVHGYLAILLPLRNESIPRGITGLVCLAPARVENENWTVTRERECLECDLVDEDSKRRVCQQQKKQRVN